MKKKWFEPGNKLDWSKRDSTATRRRKALKSRRGNALRTGRALQALANVTTDKATARLAALDARFFFRKLKEK